MADATPNASTPVEGQRVNIMQGGGAFGPVPRFTSGMTFTEVGNSGLRAFAGYVREEFLPQLQGRQAAVVYREMSDNSPIIGAMLFAVLATMRKVEWRTVPANDTPAAQEMADFAESLRHDMSITWEDTLAESFSMLNYGYAPQEIVYKRRLGRSPGMDPTRPGRQLPGSDYDDGRIGWRKLPLRGQDTVIKWFFDENGEVLGVTQQPYTGPLIDIPIEKMLLFRPTAHKSNPEGRSILRNSYRSYYMVKRLEEQETILYERMNGLPVVRVPSTLIEAAAAGDSAAAAAMAQYQAMAINLRIDEQMGVVMPSDLIEGTGGAMSNTPAYSVELIAPGGNNGRASTTADPVIQRHQTNMLMSTLADFIALGHGTTGTQALSVNKTDMFFQAIEGWLNAAAATYNRHGLRRLWDLNGLDHDLMPEYQPDLAQRIDLDILGKYVASLAQSGMALFPNADLEGALLDAAGLPDIQDQGAGELVPADPVPIVGPNAAPPQLAGAAEPAPNEPGSPADNFQKMVLASMARRYKQQAGPASPLNSGPLAARMRKAAGASFAS